MAALSGMVPLIGPGLDERSQKKAIGELQGACVRAQLAYKALSGVNYDVCVSKRVSMSLWFKH